MHFFRRKIQDKSLKRVVRKIKTEEVVNEETYISRHPLLVLKSNQMKLTQCQSNPLNVFIRFIRQD